MKSFLPVVREKNKKTREAPHYKAKQAIWLAFFSGKLYVDVIKRWRGLGVLYFFLIISVMVLPFSIQLMGTLNQVIEQRLLLPIKRLPPLSIRNGEVIFHSPMPYLIKNDAGDVVSIIDTEGHINQLPVLAYPLASILITKHEIHFNFGLLDLMHIPEEKQDGPKDTVIPIDVDINEDFVAATWLDDMHVPRLKHVLLFSLYPFVAILNAVIFMVILLCISLFAQLIARMAFKVRLSFLETSRLLFVAATPLVALCSVLILSHKVLPGKGIPYIALLVMYFSFGLLAYRRSRKEVAVQ